MLWSPSHSGAYNRVERQPMELVVEERSFSSITSSALPPISHICFDFVLFFI